jgi:hypothetical protein
LNYVGHVKVPDYEPEVQTIVPLLEKDLLVLAHPNYSFKTQKEFSDYVEYAVKN